jgi:hypothetical protein
MPHVDELHTQHDPMLMVSLASGDLAPADPDHVTAQSLLTSCTECARLHDDVLAIARATKVLPAVARTRDFRITDEQAAKLRPAGVRGFLGRLAAGPLLSRQLGAGLATLGLAGLLITAGPSIQIGGFASSGAAASQPAAAAPAPAAGYESLESDGAAGQQAPSAAATSGQNTFSGFGDTSAGASPAAEVDTAASAAPVYSGSGQETRNNAVPSPAAAAPESPDQLAMAPTPQDEVPAPPANVTATDGSSVVGIVSVILLVTGVLLLLARRFARGATSA